MPASPVPIGRRRFRPLTPRSRRLPICLVSLRPSFPLLRASVPLPIPTITFLTDSLRLIPVVLPLRPSLGFFLALSSFQALRPRRGRPRSWRDGLSRPRRPSSTRMLLPRRGATSTTAPVTPRRSLRPRRRTRGARSDGFPHPQPQQYPEAELSNADFTRREAEVFVAAMIGFCKPDVGLLVILFGIKIILKKFRFYNYEKYLFIVYMTI